jgi:hypothetical protein
MKRTTKQTGAKRYLGAIMPAQPSRSSFWPSGVQEQSLHDDISGQDYAFGHSADFRSSGTVGYMGAQGKDDQIHGQDSG